APGLLGLRLVVDSRIGRAPAVRRARVHFYFRGQVRLLERLPQYGLVGGRPLVVVRGDGDEELRLRLRGLKVRTVRIGGHESAAMERGNRADAIWHGRFVSKCDRPAHAVTLRAD